MTWGSSPSSRRRTWRSYLKMHTYRDPILRFPRPSVCWSVNMLRGHPSETTEYTIKQYDGRRSLLCGPSQGLELCELELLLMDMLTEKIPARQRLTLLKEWFRCGAHMTKQGRFKLEIANHHKSLVFRTGLSINAGAWKPSDLLAILSTIARQREHLIQAAATPTLNQSRQV